MINCCYSTLLLALNNNNICPLFHVDKRLKSIEPQKNLGHKFTYLFEH